MRISDWSSDVCSSDLATLQGGRRPGLRNAAEDVVRGYRDVGGELAGNILEEAVDSVILRCVSGGADQHGPGGCADCNSFQHSRSFPFPSGGGSRERKRKPRAICRSEESTVGTGWVRTCRS